MIYKKDCPCSRAAAAGAVEFLSQGKYNAIFTPADKTGKLKATAQALLAFNGYSLVCVLSDSYLVGRHDDVRFCPNLAELELFAAEVSK